MRVCCELLVMKQPADGRQSSRQTFRIQKIIVVEREEREIKQKKLIIILLKRLLNEA